MTRYAAFLFPGSATVFDRLAFRRMRGRLKTGFVITVNFPRGGQRGVRPADGWRQVSVWLDGKQIRRRWYGTRLLVPGKPRKAIACDAGIHHIAVTVGDSRDSILDSVDVALEPGEIVHLKITPELETMLGLNDRLGIRAIQDHHHA